ncbi:FixH family protein [Sulfurimonas sp.]|uniref:FixH family protein n=1 Tax=Sulfurimonas sp. TaxID=2022749 RepID=UPI002B485F1A|nr:FixH family protein [Sulfurimonas sp.]
MKTIAKIFIIAILGASLLQAAAFEKQVKTRATKVVISSQKPLTTGNNTINISVAGEKFAGSSVSIKVFMPAMPSMPYMESIADAKNMGNGKYTADVNLAMSGTWQVHIFITPKTGKKIRAKTSINI